MSCDYSADLQTTGTVAVGGFGDRPHRDRPRPHGYSFKQRPRLYKPESAGALPWSPPLADSIQEAWR